jgi:hypothetical protein
MGFEVLCPPYVAQRVAEGWLASPLGATSHRFMVHQTTIPMHIIFCKYIDLVWCLKPTTALQDASYHSDLPEFLSLHSQIPQSLSHNLLHKLVIHAVCLISRTTLVNMKGSHWQVSYASYLADRHSTNLIDWIGLDWGADGLR